MTTQDPNWMQAWIETQQAWLARWQTNSMEQHAEAMRVGMDTLRSHLDPQGLMSASLSMARSFQDLLQAGLAATSGAPARDTASTVPFMLNAPALGLAREQQLAWQAMMRAQLEFQIRLQALLALYVKVFADSLAQLSAQLEQRAGQGQAPDDVRAMFDLWVECGEQVFAQVARDDVFVQAQAECGNAFNQLKLAQGVLIEHWLKAHDLPTRSELNSLHQRMRELQARLDALESRS